MANPLSKHTLLLYHILSSFTVVSLQEMQVVKLYPYKATEWVVDTKAVAPNTTEGVMLYILNETTVLKFQIFDIKVRLRGIARQQRKNFKAISQALNYSEDQVGLTSAPINKGVNKTLTNDIMELKQYGKGLVRNLEHQKSQHEAFDTKFRKKLSDASDSFNVTYLESVVKIKAMRRRIDSLAEDLKKYAEQIPVSPEDRTTQDQECDIECVTLGSVNELKYLNSELVLAQDSFHKEMEEERSRSLFLEKRITDLTDAFEKEKRKRAELALVIIDKELRKEDEDEPTSIPKTESDENKIPNAASINKLGEKIERVITSLDMEAKKIFTLTTLVASLFKDLANATTEQRNIKKSLSYQYRELKRHMKVLVMKLENLKSLGQVIITKTRNRVSWASPKKVSRLSNMIIDIFNQLKSLKMEGYHATGNFNNNYPGTAGKRGFGLKESQLEDMDQDVTILKKKVAYGAEWMGTLDLKIESVANTSSKGLADIKISMQDMAKLWNNETIFLRNFNTTFQQGIAALVGQQQSNVIRFFNPRFDWEGSRLSIFGYVALKHQGEWGTICDDNFDDKDAKVLCTAAGYKGGLYNNGKYKEGDGTINGKKRSLHSIWVDELHCEGTERGIEDCQRGSGEWGTHDCDHDEDVGIRCFIS